MTGRVRSISAHRHTPFDACWAICATSPGTIRTPDELPDAASSEWLTIEAPDTVAGALRAIGRWSLDQPSRRLDADDWWFRATFDVTAAPEASADLLFGGLAGECRVWLNGTPLLTSDNMHLAHACAAPPLVDGENMLLMLFTSLDARLAERRPRPRWRAPMVEHQQLRWARVSLLGRTPGWSPPAPIIGPWRAMEWIERDRIAVSDLRLQTEVNGSLGCVRLSVDLSPSLENVALHAVTLRLSRNGALYHAEALPTADIMGRYAVTLAIPDPVRWWPHTHGEPALYEAELLVCLEGTREPIAIDLGCVGFRTLTLDTRDGDFAVQVNGVSIFCRGANWTPLDVVSPAAPAAATCAALAQVQAAGLNMLRINGCMVYEDDAFFEACDRLGLLVWQDFMLANMHYPADDEGFMASLGEEARQQLARWQAHPSLTVICGNSEAEQQAAMWGAPREHWGQAALDASLAAQAHEYCPDVPYWPSSAHGGAFPHQPNVGTASYYGVGAYMRPLDDARRAGPRFASECLGLANVPAPATLARIPGDASLRSHHPGWKARVPRDLGAGWDFEDVRDHYLQRLYGVDPIVLRGADHERYLTLGRAVSAEVIEATISEWRRPGSNCRGALLWFLRDLWAGPGWGMLDELGTPKAAFHGLRRASAPVAIFMTDEGTNGVALHVVNDPGTQLNGTIEVSLYRDDGLLAQTNSRAIAVPAHAGRSWSTAEWFDGFVDISRAYRFGPAEFALVAATLRDAADHIVDRAFFFPEGLPSARRRDIDLRISSAARQPGGDVIVSISARNLAQSVYIDAEGYVAQDEHFHLAPHEERQVWLVPASTAARRGTCVTVNALNAWSAATIEIA